MMDLKESSRALTRILGDRASALERLAVISKLLTATGAAIIVVATFANRPIIGNTSAAVVFIATLFLLYTDKDNSKSLAEARTAMDHALDQQAESEAMHRKYEAAETAYNNELERLSYFQAARDLVRAILEDVATSNSQLDEVSVIDRMLKTARHALTLAHGFEMKDFHTICVYQRAVNATGVVELICRAHLRTIDCDVKQARTWKEGVGAAGTALARGEEIVVPDLRAPELGTLYSLPEKKVEDDTRYRSIAAEPISLDGKKDLWGILVATSSVPAHFSLEDRSYVDVTQSLAGMIGLAVKLVRSKAAGVAAKSHP